MRESLELELANIDRKYERRANITKAAIEIGSIGLTYLLLSRVDSLLTDMSFKEALMEPLTYIKAGGYCAYAGRILAWISSKT